MYLVFVKGDVYTLPPGYIHMVISLENSGVGGWECQIFRDSVNRGTISWSQHTPVDGCEENKSQTLRRRPQRQQSRPPTIIAEAQQTRQQNTTIHQRPCQTYSEPVFGKRNKAGRKVQAMARRPTYLPTISLYICNM